MENLETIGLREAALVLAEPRPKDAKPKTDVDGLLNLLQADILVAGVFWKSRWIRLSRQYWTALSVEKLSSLKINSQKDTNGVYEIRVANFANDFFADLDSRYGSDKDAISADLKLAILSPSKKMEVRLEKQSWQKYIDNRPEPVATSSARGRRRMDSWREMVPFVGAYYSVIGNGGKRIKVKAAAAEIVRAAREASVEAPAASTLEEILADIELRMTVFRS